jgi:hypothetical protein
MIPKLAFRITVSRGLRRPCYPGDIGTDAESGVKKLRWVLLIVIIAGCLLLWTQMLNVMCDQDVQFFSGICTINKFIPW